MVTTALELGRALGDVPVWSAPVLAPVNKGQLQRIGKTHRRVFTLEEHAITGGLGSLVAETLSEAGLAPVTRLGVEARFSELCGSYDYLLAYHGLDVPALKQKVVLALSAGNGG
jgi:transketolase